MNKIKKISNPNSQELNFSLIVLVLVAFCTFMLIVATFTQLKVLNLVNGHIKIINYIPQIPAIMFITGLLGKKYGTLSIILYILTGLFLVPIFALGGGLIYIINFNFGYILGFAFACFFASKIIENNCSFLRLFLANITGLITIHLIGIIYLSTVLCIEKEDIFSILTWIQYQSTNNLIPDFLFGFFAISLGNFIKFLLKKFA